MSRNAPTYASGSLPAVGSGQRVNILQLIETQLTSYQSNGEDAWELLDEMGTGAAFEKVFHSVGDRSLGSGSNKGDTDIYVKIYISSDDFSVRVFQDWSPTSSTGYRASGTGFFAQTVSDTDAVDWWMVVNEYEFLFIMLQSGSFDVAMFGNVIRPYSAALNGVARITSQSGTGNGVIIGVDRDITSNIQVGQTVWLVNQTPAATPLQSVGVDLVVVTAKSAGTITVDGVTNTYAVGSLLGVDPCPGYTKTVLSSATSLYMVSKMDGTYVSNTGQAASIVNPGATAISESSFDPGGDQLYRGFQPYAKMTLDPAGFRGKFQHLRAFTFGTQIDGDLMEVDYDSNQRWKVLSSVTMFSSWVTAFGPGAS